jgi:hypothetical protein
LVNNINENIEGFQTFRVSIRLDDNQLVDVTVSTLYRYVDNDSDDKPTVEFSLKPKPSTEISSSDMFLILNRCIFLTKPHERFYLDKALYTLPSLSYRLMDFNTSGNDDQDEFDKFQIALKKQVSVTLNKTPILFPLKIHIIPVHPQVFNGTRFFQSIIFPHIFIFLNTSSFSMTNEDTQPYKLDISPVIDISSIEDTKKTFSELNTPRRKFKTTEIKEYLDSIVAIASHNIYGYVLPRDLIQLKTDSTVFKQPISIVAKSNLSSVDYLRVQDKIRYILKDLNHALFSQCAPFLPRVQQMILPRGGIELSTTTKTWKYNRRTKKIIIPFQDILQSNPYLFYDQQNDKPLEDITRVIKKYFDPLNPTLFDIRINNLRNRFKIHYQFISVYVDMLTSVSWTIDSTKWKKVIIDTLLVKFILSHLYFRFPDLNKIWLTVEKVMSSVSISGRLFKTPDSLHKFYLDEVIYSKIRLSYGDTWKKMTNIESSLVTSNVSVVMNGETNIYTIHCNRLFGNFLASDTTGFLETLKNATVVLFGEETSNQLITSSNLWKTNLMKYHMYNDNSRYMFSLNLLKYKEQQFVFTPSSKTSISLLPKSLLKTQLLDGIDVDRRLSSITSIKSKFQRPITPQKQPRKKKKDISPQKSSPQQLPAEKKQFTLLINLEIA